MWLSKTFRVLTQRQVLGNTAKKLISKKVRLILPYFLTRGESSKQRGKSHLNRTELDNRSREDDYTPEITKNKLQICSVKPSFL